MTTPSSSSADMFAGSRTRHGTTAGYELHRRSAERPCPACYQAKAEYDSRRRSATDQQQKSQARARAQGRALKRLKQAHVDEYARYYQEEKARA